jgi:hypothetical protein
MRLHWRARAVPVRENSALITVNGAIFTDVTTIETIYFKVDQDAKILLQATVGLRERKVSVIS